MKGRVFLVHWNQSEAEAHAESLRARGWDVETEAEDGARAGKRVAADPPSAVVVYLTRLPSHGRATGSYLLERKATRDIPVIFVDGAPDAVEKTRAAAPKGIHITAAELDATLERVTASK